MKTNDVRRATQALGKIPKSFLNSKWGKLFFYNQENISYFNGVLKSRAIF